VVFFRKQDDLDDGLQKELANRLGQLSGKPSTSGLHIHPVINPEREGGGEDYEISIIGVQQERKALGADFSFRKRQSLMDEWHSDITFEACPSDYAVLRMVEVPRCGGGNMT
jgi:alpha-ketoglutarate-dependent taurine dioxygenase